MIKIKNTMNKKDIILFVIGILTSAFLTAVDLFTKQIIIDKVLSTNKLNLLIITIIFLLIFVVTFALFTRGIDKFREFYESGMLDGVYTTNLSYIPEDYKKEPWLHVCDCSKQIADIIFHIHNDMSISGILRDKSQPVKMLEMKFNGTLLDKKTD